MSYSQPGYTPRADFPADKVIGIIIIVLNALLACLAMTVVVGGGIAGGAIGAAMEEAAREGAATGGDAAAAGLLGMGIMAIGVALLVSSVLGIICGVGILKSANWGFILGAILGIVNVLLSFVPLNLIGIIIGGGMATYCILRMTGNVGPKPA